MTKTFKGLSVVMILVTLCLMITGVFGSWTYARGDVLQRQALVNITVFPWVGSDILPDDNEEGNNHIKLIQNLIDGSIVNDNGSTTGIGLNDPDSELNGQLQTRQNWGKSTFGSMDAWTGSQYEALFGLNGESENLSFLIYSPSTTVKYIYTTSVYLGEQGVRSESGFTYPTGETIYPIYRTKLNGVRTGTQNGKAVYTWTAESTVLGSATSARYENTVFGSGLVYTPAWNPTTFKPINQDDCESGETAKIVGTNSSNAIFTYVGQTLKGGLEKASDVVYFKIKPKNNGVVTFTLGADTEGLTIKVSSNANMNKVVSTTNPNGTITFTATSGTTYYYTVTGNVNATFTIS